MSEVSSTRLYLGNLPRNATKSDVENHFATHGTGEITEIKLMNGFGFIEYKDAMDARDVVPAFHGSDFMGERLVVQFARGSRPRNENFAHQERTAPRPRRTPFRMNITGLPTETSWQDLKDFARQSGLDVVYSEVGRERDGRGFVEYETAADLTSAVEKLDNREFKGNAVRCVADVSTPSSRFDRHERKYTPKPPLTNLDVFGNVSASSQSNLDYPYITSSHYEQIQPERPRDRFRSRSPPPGRRGGYGPPPGDDYYYHDRRGPPRGYSPRRDDYRRRSPPPRDYYDSRDRYGRASPRRGGPPVDDGYGPPRGARYPDDAPYDARGPPPPRRAGYEPDPYMNGHSRPYGGPPSPGRRGPPRSPPGRGGYDGGYDRRPYW